MMQSAINSENPTSLLEPTIRPHPGSNLEQQKLSTGSTAPSTVPHTEDKQPHCTASLIISMKEMSAKIERTFLFSTKFGAPLSYLLWEPNRVQISWSHLHFANVAD